MGCGTLAMVFRCSYARLAEKAVDGAEAETTAGGVICATTRKVTRPMVIRDTRTGSQNAPAQSTGARGERVLRRMAKCNIVRVVTI